MANTYYSIRVDSAANCVADLKAALLDYYGAYADPANPTGVAVLYDTSPYLIFTCTAIADKPIRIYIGSSQRLFINYGSGYTAGNDVDDPVSFAGSYLSVGTTTEMHLVLGPHTMLLQHLANAVISKLVLVGQLSSGDYAVLGMIGSNNAIYNAGAVGYNTTDGTSIYPVTLATGFQSAAGKLYTQALILRNGAVGVELNGDGSIASFQDVANASYVTANNAAVWGATFVLTYSQMYMDGALQVLPTCLLMEYEEVT